jgi:hypothetical protein
LSKTFQIKEEDFADSDTAAPGVGRRASVAPETTKAMSFSDMVGIESVSNPSIKSGGSGASLGRE